MLTRLIDFLKVHQITGFLTNLTSAGGALERTEVDVSSLVDTWMLLRDIELNGERNRAMYVLKSRGTAHSNQLREFLLTDHGLELLDVYTGAEGVLTGSARLAQEARERATLLEQQQEVERRERELARKRAALDARITALRKEFENEEEELRRLIGQEQNRESVIQQNRAQMLVSRHGAAAEPSRTRPEGRGNGSGEVFERE